MAEHVYYLQVLIASVLVEVERSAKGMLVEDLMVSCSQFAELLQRECFRGVLV